MADVLTAYKALEEAEKAAKAMVEAARLEFGRAMYEARHRPPHLGKVEQKAIEEAVGLKRERLRQIEKMYTDTLTPRR